MCWCRQAPSPACPPHRSKRFCFTNWPTSADMTISYIYCSLPWRPSFFTIPPCGGSPVTCAPSERELCCDEIAVSAGAEAVAYARALAELDSARWIQPTVMAAHGGSLADRIARLLGQPSTSRRASCGPGTVLGLLLLAIGAWVVFAQPTVGPQFEVASVKPSFNRSVQNVRPLPGRLTADATPQIHPVCVWRPALPGRRCSGMDAVQALPGRSQGRGQC